jgi:hypothetical protein
MEHLYTRSGRLLQRSGNQLHSRSGSYIGQLQNGKVYDPAGRYAGTIVGERVVYRTIDSAGKTAASAAVVCAASTLPNLTGSSIWGIEPKFED